MASDLLRGKASNKSGGEQTEIPSEGNHPGVLVAIVDIGTHTNVYNGQETTNRKLYCVWELTDEQLSGTNRNQVIGTDLTLSFHKKAKIREWMERIRGKDYQEGEDVDYTKALGYPCLVDVKHKENADKTRTYAVLKGVSRLMKGMAAPKAQRTQFLWLIGDGTPMPKESEEWWLYGKSVKDWIEESAEWKKRESGEDESGTAGGSNGPQRDDPQREEVAFDPAEDIPF
jgi:hypothetical protein